MVALNPGLPSVALEELADVYWCPDDGLVSMVHVLLNHHPDHPEYPACRTPDEPHLPIIEGGDPYDDLDDESQPICEEHGGREMGYDPDAEQWVCGECDAEEGDS